MNRVLFNNDWKVTKIDGMLLGPFITGFKEGKPVTLPHDAMIEEEKSEKCLNSFTTGYYPGGVYRYTKRFLVPEEWRDKTVTIELEGVYMSAFVFLNGEHMLTHNGGYSNFYVNLDSALLYGEENELEVIANNSGEPNSRWYTGSGIYRNVNLIVGNLLHIKNDSIRVTTPEIDDTAAVVVVEAQLENQENQSCRANMVTRIYGPDHQLVSKEETPAVIYRNETVSLRQRITVLEPKLWDCDHPELYSCEIEIMTEDGCVDRENVSFGIRRLSLDAQRGLMVNGREVKLRGACIHHDNGIIGACTLQKAEERKCRLLKEAGFNCIRSAHNPISKELLDACDRIGMYVMDELWDMWNFPKNANDNAMFFPGTWKEEVRRMVEKDFNHPSVLMYSTGNEIPEVGRPSGSRMNRAISEEIRKLDPARYVTSAFNALLASIDYKMEISAAMRKKAASENKELNDLMGERESVVSGNFLKNAHVHPIMTEKIDEYMAPLDIAGYNYVTIRHEMDRETRPNRVIIGSETFPSEIAQLWEVVERNKHVIGDMTWTGMEHLGESNLQLMSYEGEEDSRLKNSNGVGDIDLLGHRKQVSYYREIVFGLRRDPYITVERPEHYGRKLHRSAWAFEDSVSSWCWSGFEHQPVVVNVFGDGDEVELFVNGGSMGRKAIGEEKKYTASFRTVYEPGRIEAVLYKDGQVCGKHVLETVGEGKKLYAEADRTVLTADGQDIAFVTVSLRDEQGRDDLQAADAVRVEVKGPGYLAGYGNADLNTDKRYSDPEWPMYDGYVQAAVRTTCDEGDITVTFTSEGYEPVTVLLQARK